MAIRPGYVLRREFNFQCPVAYEFALDATTIARPATIATAKIPDRTNVT